MLELAALLLELEALLFELLASEELLFELLELEALLFELLELLLFELEELLAQPVKAKEQQRTATDTNAIIFFMYKYLLSKLVSINQITLTLRTTKTNFKAVIAGATTFFMIAKTINQNKYSALQLVQKFI